MADTTTTASPSTNASTQPDPLWGKWNDWTPACLVLRFALALLVMITGVEKFRSPSIPSTYSIENWTGTKEEQQDGKGRMIKTVSVPYRYSGLDNEALLPPKISNGIAWTFYAFGVALPWVMIGAGFLILIGLFNKLAHCAAAAMWIILMAGQTILPEYSIVQMLLMFAVFHGLALTLQRHNRLALTRF